MSRPALLILLCVGLGACDDDNGSMDMSMDLSAHADGGDMGPAGSAQACTGTFMADSHCDAMADAGAIMSTTDQNSCHPNTDAGATMVDYGDTMCGTMGKDDDCKYTVSWTSTGIYENTPVDFTVTLGANAPGNQVTGAMARAEVFLSDTHPAPSSGGVGAESAGGVYKISGVKFDAPGMWTVRFHFFEECSDFLDDSPHGHAAFFVNVP